MASFGQMSILVLAGSFLLTACGTVAPPTGLRAQANGDGQPVQNTGSGPGGYPTTGLNTAPANTGGLNTGIGSSPTLQQPSGSGEQPIPQTLPADSSVPQTGTGPVPPSPGRILTGPEPVGGGYLALSQCIENYISNIRFVMAPTEAQLAGLRETARQQCLSKQQGGFGQP